jgi:hypothetical protein
MVETPRATKRAVGRAIDVRCSAEFPRRAPVRLAGLYFNYPLTATDKMWLVAKYVDIRMGDYPLVVAGVVLAIAIGLWLWARRGDRPEN